MWRGAEGLVRMFQRLWRDQGGASLIEYTILIALITVMVIVGVSVAGSMIQSMWVQLLPMLG
jgi:Flp pilus assembly pilin Flp